MRRLLAFLIFAYGAAMFGVAAYIYLYADPDTAPEAEVIAILSGPGGDQPGTAGETRARVDRGVALFRAGAAPLIAVTGGIKEEDEPSQAERMADRAAELGVPRDAILVESAAASTLQNALFLEKFDQIDPEQPIIIVTHRYHLPRAWASFRWAGFSDITLVAADPEGGIEITGPLLMEGIKWPVNILRAAGASAALAMGADEATVMPWLR